MGGEGSCGMGNAIALEITVRNELWAGGEAYRENALLGMKQGPVGVYWGALKRRRDLKG